LRLFPDHLEIVTGILDVGQGIYTILIQLAAEIFRCEPKFITIHTGNSSSTPESPLTAGSTATFSTGLALEEAAKKLKEQLFGISKELLDIEYKDLTLRNFSLFSKVDARQTMSVVEIFSHLKIPFLEVNVTSKPWSTTHIVNSFAAHFAQLDIEVRTGTIKLMRYVAVHDSGIIINHNMAVNQVEGGVNQMLGLALQEEIILDSRTGRTLNPSFLEHKSFLINDYQPIETEFVQTRDPIGPFGAKALGEPPSVPVLAVIGNALYDATGIRFTKVPITRENLLSKLTQID
jgi:xanthine dehydrogenase molybdenum-binding subunit